MQEAAAAIANARVDFQCLFVWCHNAILTTTYPTTQAAFNGDLSLVESRGWTLSPTIICGPL